MTTDGLSEEQFEAAVAQMLHRRAADIDLEDDGTVVLIGHGEADRAAERSGSGRRLVLAAAAVAVMIAGLAVWMNRPSDGAITIAEQPNPPANPDPAQPAARPAPSVIYAADGTELFTFGAEIDIVERPYNQWLSDEWLARPDHGPQAIGGTEDTRIEVVRRLLMGCDAHVDPALAAHIASSGEPFFTTDTWCAGPGGGADASVRPPFGDGLRIYTSFDQGAQQAADAAIDSVLPDDPRGFAMAVVSVEPGSGAIRTIASSEGLSDYPADLATALPGWQPGSAYKTVVAAAALNEGLLPDDFFDGRGPCAFPDETSPSGEYVVQNFSNSPGSIATLRSLMLSSSNCGAVTIGQIVGLDNVVEVGKLLGLDQKLLGWDEADSSRSPLPVSIPLGTTEQTPLSMAVMQATLAHGGVRYDPFVIERIETADGQVLYQHQAKGVVAVGPDVACRTIEILAANVRAGTGTRAGLVGHAAAGKTGTVEGFSDAWFVGSTPYLATAVWMGLPKRVNVKPQERAMVNVGEMNLVTGGTFPAQAWGAYNNTLLANRPTVGDADTCPPPAREGRFHALAGERDGQSLPTPELRAPVGTVIPAEDSGAVRCPASHPTGIDSDADGIIDRCLAPDPE